MSSLRPHRPSGAHGMVGRLAALLGGMVALVIAAPGCPRERPGAEETPALLVGRIDAELRAVGAEGEPTSLETSVEGLTRAALSKASSIRAADEAGAHGAGRLRVTAFVGPDGVTGKLHAIVDLKLSGAAPLPLEWEAKRVSGASKAGQDEYVDTLAATVTDAVRALDAQAGVATLPAGEVEGALRSASVPARLAAARVLGLRRERDAVGALCDELDREDPIVAPAAASALAAIGDPAGVPCIERWSGGAEDRAPMAIRVLGAMSHASARTALEKIASSHSSAHARRLAATEMAKQDRRGDPVGARDSHEHDEEELPAALKSLVTALSDEDQRVRLGAAKALAETRSPLAVAPLCTVLERQETEEVLAAISALAELGDAAAIPCLMRWSAADERRLALIVPALAAIGGPEAAGVLELLAREARSDEIRRIVRAALEQVERAEEGGPHGHGHGRGPAPPQQGGR